MRQDPQGRTEDQGSETRATGTSVGPIEDHDPSDAQPENVQARVFTRLAASTGNDPMALAAFLRRTPPRLTPQDLAVVTCPVLVVLGEEDFVPSADRLVEALPLATLVSVPGVNHFATPSDFGVIDATLRFLGMG